jgi:hypothetical protein
VCEELSGSTSSATTLYQRASLRISPDLSRYRTLGIGGSVFLGCALLCASLIVVRNRGISLHHFWKSLSKRSPSGLEKNAQKQSDN